MVRIPIAPDRDRVTIPAAVSRMRRRDNDRAAGTGRHQGGDDEPESCLDSNRPLLRRTVTFRGDTDTAFRRAAEFVGETLKDAMPRP